MVQFEGNGLLKDADLGKATRLKPNTPLTKAAVQADVARIVELYQRPICGHPCSAGAGSNHWSLRLGEAGYLTIRNAGKQPIRVVSLPATRDQHHIPGKQHRRDCTVRLG
jgi:hypothetical protein